MYILRMICGVVFILLGALTSNDALNELQKYSDWWNSYGGVTYIELYNINGDKAYTVAEGDIYTIANYIISVTT